MKISPYISTDAQAQTNKNNISANANKTSAQSFLEFMEKSPEKMLFESFLKKNNLTEEAFNQLPLQQKQELLKEFEEEMKREVGLIG